MKAIILAGGLGKRLRPLTEKIPKPLLDVAGKPILEWQIIWLRYHGFRDIVLAVGYLWEKIRNVFGDGSRLNVSISYAIEEEPLGTGGALRNTKNLLEDSEKFIVLNGDILTNIDLSNLCRTELQDAVGVLSLVPLPSPYGIVEFDKESMIIRSFVEKPIIRDYWINAGIYFFNKPIFDYLPEKGDIEKTAFPKLAE
ncbi:MAG: nucleotidyltransferase family protein [Nitrososphaerota archaeon]